LLPNARLDEPLYAWFQNNELSTQLNHTQGGNPWTLEESTGDEEEVVAVAGLTELEPTEDRDLNL
jgi:hypothetical protein